MTFRLVIPPSMAMLGLVTRQVQQPPRLNFAAAVNDSIGSPFTISGSITPKVTQVETDLNNLNSLSSTLAAESGTNLAINPGAGKTQTIDITAGKLVNGNYVFNVTTLNFNNNNDTLDIVGNPGTTQHVVFNIASANVNDPQFQGTINLLDGLTSNDVLFNITGSSNSNLQINGGTVKYGTFLDPNGTIGVGSGTVYGCVFGGGNNDFQVNSGATINCPEDIPENTPEPPAWTLGLCVAALLTVLRLRARLPRV